MTERSRTRTRSVRALSWLVLWSVSACGGGALTALRFQNSEPVWLVSDRVPIPEPEPRYQGGRGYTFDALMRRPLLDPLALPDRPHALNVNAWDEVPTSSWFENRVGARALSPAEIARGPGRGGGPDRSAPLRVKRAQVEGELAPQFLVEDARGDRYFIKLDREDKLELESGAEVVVQRLLWAAGYHVPENDVVFFERGDLELAVGAVERMHSGKEVPLTAERLDAVLRNEPKTANGIHVRALASKYLSGTPLGGFAMDGVRPDDPNDTVAHEHRRELRAYSVFCAWLGSTDIKENNTLDMWIEQPKGSGFGHVIHYVLDFGKSLGAWGKTGAHEHDGYAPHFDYGYALKSALTLGLWKRPWEGAAVTELRGVGRYDAAHFRPDVYAPARWYTPFAFLDRFDAFWAAKVIARFRVTHVAAAVRQGKYSDPATTHYLVRTIEARRQKLVRHHFGRVNPLDGFRVEPERDGYRICARDLFVARGFAPAANTRYALSAYDYDGDALDFHHELTADSSGQLCASTLRPPADRDGYVMVAFHTTRSGQRFAPVIAHLARSPHDGALRVIGVERRR
jgi:hypothetical protein